MKRVFISYSRKNKTFAERIARDLSDAGLDVWIDFRQIQGGERWADEIFRGIDRAEMVVFCQSPDSVVSEWCQKEVLTAREKGKYIIPVMVANAMPTLQQTEAMKWLLDVHFINFEGRYEEAFPELLDALPGLRRVGTYDDVDAAKIPNPFKGLEAFQQTDAQFFFGREALIAKSMSRLSEDRPTRFLAVVGASGSGKSSLVRAGVIPAIRRGDLPGSDTWPIVIFTPGAQPIEALATRLLPLLSGHEKTDDATALATTMEQLEAHPEALNSLAQTLLGSAPDNARLVMVVDQFEEVFTRAGETEREPFLKLLHHAVTVPKGRTVIIVTMRADFFGQLSRYPDLAELFEQENMVIATEMTSANLLRSIQGPAEAVGLVYDPGLVERILEDVRRQPGSLPLLQYALKELYERREGRRLTMAAYEAIGGVQRALAQHAEQIYQSLTPTQQAIMRRVLLQLVEVSESGEATRRRVNRAELIFSNIPNQDVQEVIDLLTAAESRLLITSREITSSTDEQSAPITWLEVSHEALIREWDRFEGWIAENVESLRYSSELLAAAHDWDRGGRDVAYLLTGKRLVRAEAWLETADANPLQRAFVDASAKESERRASMERHQQERELELQRRSARNLRYFVVVLLAGLVLTIALAGFSLNSLDRANQSADREKAAANTSATLAAESERSADEANSLALSSSAQQAQSDQNSQEALALAVQANQIVDPPPQSQRTLAQVAYGPGLRQQYTLPSAVNSLAFSPDGTVAVAGLADNTIIEWSLETGKVLRQFGSPQDKNPSDGHTGSVNSVAFSADGHQLLSGSADKTLILWNVDSGEIIQQFGGKAGHADMITSVAFSPDGKSVLSGSADKTMILWDIQTGAILQRFGLNGEHKDAVTTVAFSPDGKTAASGSADFSIGLWDVATGKLLHRLGAEAGGHQGKVWSVAFSSDGTTLVSAAADENVITWNVATGKASQQVRVGGNTQGGSFVTASLNPNGAQAAFATSDSRVIVIDSVTGQSNAQLGGGVGDILSLAFSADGRHVLSGGRVPINTAVENLNQNTNNVQTSVSLWDVFNAEEIRRFNGHDSRVDTVAFSPNGRLALSGSSQSDTQAGELRLWDVDTGKTVQQFLGHTAPVLSAVFSPDGQRILSASQDKTLILWDVQTGQAIRTFSGHTDVVYAAAISPDGKTALSVSRDKTMILWDLDTGQALRTFTGFKGAVFTVAFSPDGKTALSGQADNTLILWDVTTGQAIGDPFTGHSRAVRSVAFSHDGTLAVSGSSDNSLIVWDVNTHAPKLRLTGHNSAVLGVAFSPDDRYVVSGSQDGTLRLWDLTSGFELRRYETELSGVTSVAISPDGRSVLSGMTDTTVRLWRLLPSIKDLLDWTFANRVVGELDCATRIQFKVQPLCDAGAVPTRTPYPLPTVTLPPNDFHALTIGGKATVNTTNGDGLNIRSNPGMANTAVGSLKDGAFVTIVDGPRQVDGLVWWQVRADNGLVGWAVDSTGSEQTLVP